MIDALPLLLAPEGYQISRSVRLRESASAWFARTNSTSGQDPLKWTFSAWVKRGSTANFFPFIGSNTGTAAFTFIGFWNENFQFRVRNSSSVDLIRVESTAVFRDPSAWYHVVAIFDTANAVSTDRIKLFVNGVQLTSFVTATFPSLNQGTTGTFATNPQLGRTNTNSSNQNYGDGYITEVNFVDGQALLPSSFGEFDAITGVWKPKKYVGTYGTNGFYLNFSDNSAATAAAIGKDYSGNGNNWTPNNISVTAGSTYDSMIDVPTMYADGGNGRGNYAVLNPLDRGSSGTISDGNLATSSQTASANGTFGLTTGKWYFEASFSSITGASSQVEVGIQAAQIQGYLNNGNKDLDTTQSAYGATFTTGDTIGCAFDLDAKQMTFYKNGTSQGTFTYTVADTYFPMIRARGTTTFAGTINFGQRPFSYTPPTGFKALNTQNLPDSLVEKGNQYFDATIYTGNGSTQNIVNSGDFQPDLVWTKLRSLSAGHNLVDSVRGVTKALYSNLTNAETTDALGLTAFNANGFTLGGASGYNNNGATAVGWQWKKGATQGFDIVTYTGTGAARTVSHSLGIAPSMMIVRNRSNGTVNWRIYHKSIGAANFLSLNLTNASAAASSVWNNTEPTSSVFSVANDGGSNGSGENMVAYLFAEVAGFSKFGSYIGNGSADGPFVYLGFRPRFIMLKNASAVSDWLLFDTARNTYNLVDAALRANLAQAEGTQLSTNQPIDALSNGFKVRGSGSNGNGNGNTIIFAAFAENPFKNSLAR